MKKIHLFSSRYPFLILLGLNLICYLLLHFGIDNGLKVEIRQALTTKPLETPAIFLAHPDSLPKFKFDSYKEEKLKEFFQKNKNVLRAHYKVNPEKSSIEKAKDIVLSFSKNGGRGCGEYSSDLMKNIEWTTTGGGCCSDHAQVFIAISLLNRVYAREVNHTSHTFNEFWDEERGKWVWIDPQFCMLAKDGSGNYLSLFEIYTFLKESINFTWEFFGTPKHEFHKIDPARSIYYQTDQFKSIYMTMSNRVFLQDSWNKKLWFLPRDLRQTILIIFGIGSQYSIWGFDSAYFTQLEKTRSIFLALLALFLLVNFSLIFYFYKCKTCRNL